jgi:hypothetical protein
MNLLFVALLASATTAACSSLVALWALRAWRVIRAWPIP